MVIAIISAGRHRICPSGLRDPNRAAYSLLRSAMNVLHEVSSPRGSKPFGPCFSQMMPYLMCGFSAHSACPGDDLVVEDFHSAASLLYPISAAKPALGTPGRLLCPGSWISWLCLFGPSCPYCPDLLLCPASGGPHQPLDRQYSSYRLPRKLTSKPKVLLPGPSPRWSWAFPCRHSRSVFDQPVLSCRSSQQKRRGFTGCGKTHLMAAS